MSGRHERLETGPEPMLDVSVPSGSLRIDGGDDGVVVVDVRGPDADEFVIERRGGVVVVAPSRSRLTRWRSHDVAVTVPPGTQVRARLASADCDVTAALAALEVDTASGDVRAGDLAGDLRVRSASGSVRAGDVAGAANLTSASGTLALAGARGIARTSTASGDVRLGLAASSLKVKTASGDVEVGHYAGADLECVTMSGDVRVGLTRGRVLDLDLQTLAGDIRSEFEVGADDDSGGGERGRIEIRSLSGDIALVAAPPR